MDKEKLIDTINQRGLGSLMTIYYNIGGALPFTAQRFPDGRISLWYKSQYVEVHEIKPGGKSGKYGKAYGFYFRNGERADAWEDGGGWCTKEETIPQEIPSASCGSWFLLDILGEPITDITKNYGINDVLELGMYKGMTLAEVIHTDWEWVKWAMRIEHFSFNIDEVMEERKKDIIILHPEDVLPFGKYIGQTIKKIAEADFHYLQWFDNNYEDFKIDFEEIYNFHQEIRVLHPEDKLTFGKYKGKCIKYIAEKDLQYLIWLDKNCEGFTIKFDELSNFSEGVKILCPEDKLTFGKYKGKCIRNIADKDLEYLRWLNNKCEGYSIDLEELKV